MDSSTCNEVCHTSKPIGRSKQNYGSYKVIVLFDGYSKSTSDGMVANCTCTLIKGPKNIIVDTMTPWDKDRILNALKEQKISPDDIDYVISTHGHSDHCGNNNLFLKATHIMGYSISHKEKYIDHPFTENVPYIIDDNVTVIPTPGHMNSHVSVLVKTSENQNIVVAGDLFENEEDLSDESIWKDAGSEDELKQISSRQKVLKIADFIIPGHGKMFKVINEN